MGDQGHVTFLNFGIPPQLCDGLSKHLKFGAARQVDNDELPQEGMVRDTWPFLNFGTCSLNLERVKTKHFKFGISWQVLDKE